MLKSTSVKVTIVNASPLPPPPPPPDKKVVIELSLNDAIDLDRFLYSHSNTIGIPAAITALAKELNMALIADLYAKRT